jgi:hypothetical protein
MKFRILALAALALALTSQVFGVALDTPLTHHRNGVAVGKYANDTMVALTPAATTQIEIPISNVRAGDFYTVLSNPAASLNAGIGTDISSTAVTFAALAGAEYVSATVSVLVPYNFGTSLDLVGVFTTSAADVACSVTAGVMIDYIGVSQSLVPVNDTEVFIPTTSASYPVEVTIYSDIAGAYPGSVLKFNILRNGGTTATLYLHRLFLRYKPDYVIP